MLEFKVALGICINRGARHGLKLNGKLLRLQEQEKLLAENRNSSSQSLTDVTDINDDGVAVKKNKKKKKRKHRDEKIDDENPGPGAGNEGPKKKKKAKMVEETINDAETKSDINESREYITNNVFVKSTTETIDNTCDISSESNIETTNKTCDIGSEEVVNFTDSCRKKKKKKRNSK